MRACWRAYSAQHRESRRLLNKLYVQRPEVKKRRKELYQAKKVARKLVEHGEPMLAFRKTPQILQRVEGGSQDSALSALGLTMREVVGFLAARDPE